MISYRLFLGWSIIGLYIDTRVILKWECLEHEVRLGCNIGCLLDGLALLMD